MYLLLVTLAISSCKKTAESPEELVEETRMAVRSNNCFVFTEYYSEKSFSDTDTSKTMALCQFLKEPSDSVFGYYFSIEFPDSGKTLIYKDDVLMVVWEKQRRIKKIDLEKYGKIHLQEEIPSGFLFSEDRKSVV